MALADSGRAIGAVTKLLREHLMRRGFAVSVGKPEQAALTDSAAKLNLFLYETHLDPSLRNVTIDDRRPAPLWLSLKYLLTAFDDAESSDSADAHELLGRGLSALHELNFLSLDALVASDVRQALENCPEPLKLNFEETPADLLSKVMQGTDEKYRLSVAFEVRPVMIVPAEPPAYSLLVGVDYTEAPPEVIGEEGIGLAVLASMGPRLTAVEPALFDPGAGITLRGEDLHLSNLECMLGGVPLCIVSQRTDRLTVRAEGQVPGGAAEGPIAAGGALSAGEHALLLRQLMPNQRYRTSNLLAGRLRPVVNSAMLDGGGTLTIAGLLLGTWSDDVLVALYLDGAVARVYEPGPPPPAPLAPLSVAPGADQKSLTIAGIPGSVAPGRYLVIVRVNGQQARLSPAITVA